jgi:hypothetical protein
MKNVLELMKKLLMNFDVSKLKKKEKTFVLK